MKTIKSLAKNQGTVESQKAELIESLEFSYPNIQLSDVRFIEVDGEWSVFAVDYEGTLWNTQF
ncbi:hypothetical protein HOT82_gp143 [Gordonia phage Ronaldo]|uniref:Uncharacterized protein n=4 Tax=Ronaldovirus TaxID=2733205 RepID=A0A6B9L8P6_9CAUD|nr:hypothetical protein HOT81_gp140 [Gordonia phage Fryberger]YP_009807826.1 hypothetical protein HOT82_gp143 [Gordonia phage Ronaldo]QDH48470.1 hypothetical protein SEA_ZIKO_134 [Gordonia phage Ziko]QHB38246.1 hypothetical protein SEA_VOLT_135 [Gordonia phage Volt]AXN53543.1 hypothetical protein SEA_FRYBERGER_130 [Gordonia phage Fryberger]AXN53690.1 hypothetical protein SEA_RONALDO_132 [Gordonia phage Ronaldo]